MNEPAADAPVSIQQVTYADLVAAVLVLESEGRRAEAERIVEWLQPQDSAAAAYLQSLLLERRSQLGAALKAVEKAIRKGGRDYWLVRRQAELLLALERYAEAYDVLRDAPLVFETELDAVMQVLELRAALHLEDPEKIESAALRLIGALHEAETPEHPLAPLAAEAWAGAAAAALRYGRPREAMIGIHRAESYLKEPALILHLMRGKAWILFNELEKAAALVAELVADHPDDPGVLTLKADLCRAQGRTEEAIQIMRRVQGTGWSATELDAFVELRGDDWASVRASLSKDRVGYRSSVKLDVPLKGLRDPVQELAEVAIGRRLAPKLDVPWGVRLFLSGYPAFAALFGYLGWPAVNSVLVWAPITLSVATILFSFFRPTYALSRSCMSASTAALFGLVIAYLASWFGDQMLPVPWPVALLGAFGWFVASVRSQAISVDTSETGTHGPHLASFGMRRVKAEGPTKAVLVHVVLGSMTLDLRHIEPVVRPIEVRIVVVLGTLTLIVPYHWVVEGWDPEGLMIGLTQSIARRPRDDPHARIKGHVVFGRCRAVHVRPAEDIGLAP